MRRIAHSLVGYDRLTERAAGEIAIPDAVLSETKCLARVPDDDSDAMMCYPPDACRAHGLAVILNARIDTDRRDYFLEGFAASR
jgi:hypothetical protein